MLNRIHLGDCLDLMKDITARSVDLILCDLPYGTTQCKWDEIIPFDPLWSNYKRVIKDDGVIVLFGSGVFTAKLILSNTEMYKYSLIWEKSHATGFLNCKKRVLPKHEDVLVFYDKAGTFNPQLSDKPVKNIRPINVKNRASQLYRSFNPGNHRTIPTDKSYPVSVLKFDCEGKTKVIHPTQKPVPLLEYFIKTYSNEGDTVLDNCSGSGATAVACINTGRDFVCIEREPLYHFESEHRLMML